MFLRTNILNEWSPWGHSIITFSQNDRNWILYNLTIGRYLYFHKHRCRNLIAYLNIYSRESIFLLKGNSAIQFNYWNDDSEKFKGFRQNKVLITSHLKVFLGNKCNSYIRAAQNAKVTSTRNVYEKTVIKRKKKGFQRQFRTHSNIYDEAFNKIVNGVT